MVVLPGGGGGVDWWDLKVLTVRRNRPLTTLVIQEINEMKGFLSIIVGLIGLALAFGGGWISNNRVHQDTAANLWSSQVRAVETKFDEERKRGRDLEEALKKSMDTIADLEVKVTKYELAAEAGNMKAPDGTTRPYSVRAYLGTKFLGNADLIFTRSRSVTDADGTMRVVQEPIIRLPENYKSFFTTVTTNIVEREVVRHETVYNNTSNNFNPGVWGYNRLNTIHNATPLDTTSHSAPSNPYIINDELTRPRVQSGGGVVIPNQGHSGQLSHDRQGLIQQPLLTPAASIRTTRP